MNKSAKAGVGNYAWKAGASEFKAYDPEVIANELNKIREQRGELKADGIVDAARNPKNPLHTIFPWDDATAAQIGREAIASRLVRSIRVTITMPDRKQIDTRAFQSVRDPNAKGNRSYDFVTHTLEEPEGRAFLLRRAWMELRAWRRRYQEIAELAEAFDVIDRVLDRAG